ncbi:hypothetical protein Trydic_g915 [Trypoxylus dichotomus]
MQIYHRRTERYVESACREMLTIDISGGDGSSGTSQPSLHPNKSPTTGAVCVADTSVSKQVGGSSTYIRYLHDSAKFGRVLQYNTLKFKIGLEEYLHPIYGHMHSEFIYVKTKREKK